MPHPELVEFVLPCAECSHSVTIRSTAAKEFVDAWLDSIIEVRCAIHRHPTSTP